VSTRDHNLLALSVGFALIGIFCLMLVGCQSESTTETAFTIFLKGSEGHSNDPIKFEKPLVAVRTDYINLATGQFVVRKDRIGFGTRYVLHQLVEKLPDGTWRMQGHNRLTNPKPDQELLTKENYIGVVYPLLTE
jgi:hypothetical protein